MTRGHAWQGEACVAGLVCMVEGGMHSRGACMCGRRDGHCSGQLSSNIGSI